MQEGGATSHTTQEQMHIFRRKGQATFAKLHRHFPLPTGLVWSPAKAMLRHRVWEILLQLKDAALTRHSRQNILFRAWASTALQAKKTLKPF